MATITLHPGRPARVDRARTHALVAVWSGVRHTLAACLGLADPDALAAAGVASPGHRGGVRHV